MPFKEICKKKMYYLQIDENRMKCMFKTLILTTSYHTFTLEYNDQEKDIIPS